ncbi:hypothetical protein Q8A73_010087 [Channa argus]|nr:hypothetical protein Q8A73_010087 [Channa argus]
MLDPQQQSDQLLKRSNQALKTAPVQGDDFSSGTSSHSTKLIHGGVRYLQKAIMKLDYKQEARMSGWCEPTGGDGRAEEEWGCRGPALRPKGRSGFKCAPCVARAAIALMQSDRDRCDISVPTHFHTTSHRLGVTHIPLLWSCPPAAGQHNDARMNLAIALTAARYGAAIANYTEVVHLLKRADPQTGKERVCGAHCRDVITGQEFDVRAKCVINATGPFTDALRKMDDQKNPDICQPSAGVHIVIPGYYSRPKVNAVFLFVPLAIPAPSYAQRCTHTQTHTDTASSDNMELLDSVIILLTWVRMPQEAHTTRVNPLEKNINFKMIEVHNYPALSTRTQTVTIILI